MAAKFIHPLEVVHSLALIGGTLMREASNYAAQTVAGFPGQTIQLSR